MSQGGTLNALGINANSLRSHMFSITSRYYDIPTAELETADGRTIVYLRRRFVPPPERFALLRSIR